MYAAQMRAIECMRTFVLTAPNTQLFLPSLVRTNHPFTALLVQGFDPVEFNEFEMAVIDADVGDEIKDGHKYLAELLIDIPNHRGRAHFFLSSFNVFTPTDDKCHGMHDVLRRC